MRSRVSSLKSLKTRAISRMACSDSSGTVAVPSVPADRLLSLRGMGKFTSLEFQIEEFDKGSHPRRPSEGSVQGPASGPSRAQPWGVSRTCYPSGKAKARSRGDGEHAVEQSE